VSPKEDKKEVKRLKYLEYPYYRLKNHIESKYFKKYRFLKRDSSNKIELKK
jgi:hypothetical protein